MVLSGCGRAYEVEDDLIQASQETRLLAERAIGRSRELLQRAKVVCQGSLSSRMASRRHLHYARLEGAVDGERVRAVVRKDGTLDASRRLLGRAALVVALGDSFEGGRVRASLTGSSLASTLTLIRACDWVFLLELPLARQALLPACPVWGVAG